MRQNGPPPGAGWASHAACKNLQQDYAELKEQHEALKTYCESLKDFSAYLCRIVFGRSSEKTEYLPEDEHVSEEPEEQTLSNLGDYAAAIDAMDCDCDECAEEQAVESKPLATKRKTLRSAIKEAEPIECIEYKLPKSQLVCPQCGKPLVRVGCARFDGLFAYLRHNVRLRLLPANHWEKMP